MQNGFVFTGARLVGAVKALYFMTYVYFYAPISTIVSGVL